MASDVIIMVADDAYADHARSLLVNFRRQGEWGGDFCVISPESSTAIDFQERGIDVLRVPDANWSFLTKFYIFTEYFHRWQRALCTDIDVLVQREVGRVFDGLAPRLPRILCNLEDVTIEHGLHYWDLDKADHPEVYRTIRDRWPHVGKRMFNMAFIFFSPSSLPRSTMPELLAIHEEIKAANPTAADQMLVNLHLYDRLEEAGKDWFCFFGLDDPCNRVPSEGRGWRGDEFPSLVHYCRWHAPWIVKPEWQKEWAMTPEQQRALEEDGTRPEMGAYRNTRVGRICHELYAENLAAFEEEFPVR